MAAVSSPQPPPPPPPGYILWLQEGVMPKGRYWFVVLFFICHPWGKVDMKHKGQRQCSPVFCAAENPQHKWEGSEGSPTAERCRCCEQRVPKSITSASLGCPQTLQDGTATPAVIPAGSISLGWGPWPMSLAQSIFIFIDGGWGTSPFVSAIGKVHG